MQLAECQPQNFKPKKQQDIVISKNPHIQKQSALIRVHVHGENDIKMYDAFLPSYDKITVNKKIFASANLDQNVSLFRTLIHYL